MGRGLKKCKCFFRKGLDCFEEIIGRSMDAKDSPNEDLEGSNELEALGNEIFVLKGQRSWHN